MAGFRKPPLAFWLLLAIVVAIAVFFFNFF